jgi:hypothetical protein
MFYVPNDIIRPFPVNEVDDNVFDVQHDAHLSGFHLIGGRSLKAFSFRSITKRRTCVTLRFSFLIRYHGNVAIAPHLLPK